MFDPAFHFYKICWGLTRHLNILSNYIPWTYSEKINILHYDVCMRYVNKGWKISLTGNMQKLIDINFIENMPKIIPPFYCQLKQEIYDTMVNMVLTEQYYCKNVEGYQIPFSRWESRTLPTVLEGLNKLEYFNLDDINNGKLLKGRSLLRQNSLKLLFDSYKQIKYYEWPNTDHLQQMHIRRVLKSLDLPLTVRQGLLQHNLEPHYQPLQKGVHD